MSSSRSRLERAPALGRTCSSRRWISAGSPSLSAGRTCQRQPRCWFSTAKARSSFAFPILADRLGNRLSLQWQVFGTALVPLLALLFTSGFGGFEPKHFWLTFFFLGLTPVTIKTLTNYALELAETDQHPLYVSTLHACLAVPFVLSPLVGWLVVVLRFERAEPTLVWNTAREADSSGPARRVAGTVGHLRFGGVGRRRVVFVAALAELAGSWLWLDLRLFRARLFVGRRVLRRGA